MKRKVFGFKSLLTESGWLSPAYVHVDDSGKITLITGAVPAGELEFFNALAVPGFQNAHSHAFQYAMAGLAEKQSAATRADDFWAWREAMYALALSVNPDQMEAIAAMVYSEMLRHGYTHVAEFHYLHHDKNGKRYENLSEMGERLVAAAELAGIGITLIPILYQKGGFGKDPSKGQRRFITEDVDAYWNLMAASKKSTSHYVRAATGLGIHSLRAVDPEDVVRFCTERPDKLPFHLHIAEQQKEVEDSLAYLGVRPVEWLLDSVPVDASYHLIHATHITDDECDRLAYSSANVVLCPGTEGNLGDGIFPLRRFHDHGGTWSIGTDSHISLNPLEELRLLDYGQRLTSHRRNTYGTDKNGDQALTAVSMALLTGRSAMNNHQQEFFAVGSFFDAVMFDCEAPLLGLTSEEHLISTLVYCADASHYLGTICGGKRVVENGKHIRAKQIHADFIKCITTLGQR